jgi:sigma-B regulation protein RsbU (phosphoserine phosphatase)
MPETVINADPSQRLAYIVDMMREMSEQTDPQLMVQTYGRRMRQLIPFDATISLSRRDLVYPYFRITRSTRWKKPINPWTAKDQLPLLKGGLLAELIYREEPLIMDEIQIAPDDPAAEFLCGHRSLLAIPLFDMGKALNMVVALGDHAATFDQNGLAQQMWMSNLFGRATQSLVLSDQLRSAYETVEKELEVVADIQHSLLPSELPEIPTLEMAVHYQTSRHAGGDYYDFFQLPDGRWGFLIADVSGHGTGAAVIMAVTHSIAHSHHEAPEPPSRLLGFINQHLAARYTNGNGTFVTAFYGIYDPKTRTLTYANAGHNPPRHKRAGASVIGSLESALNLPLGLESTEQFCDVTQTFSPGDAIAFYTDGITEARNSQRDLFGQERLDKIFQSSDATAENMLRNILAGVEDFTGGAPPSDDRTLLIAKVH